MLYPVSVLHLCPLRVPVPLLLKVVSVAPNVTVIYTILVSSY